MNFYSQWQNILNDPNNSETIIKRYYEVEAEAYETILSQPGEVFAGPAGELAKKLGFGNDMVIFLGFLDGINPSLKTSLDLEPIDEASEVSLDIDFPKLYWNMHEAKADWLYGIKAWDNILSPEEQLRLTKEYRTSKIVHREKIGRNEPCPCGSGKKYKNCCGKGA